jgi:hypothetical protein
VTDDREDTDIERRAYVWDTIERIAFRPERDDERNRWLGVYEKSLHKLWGLQPCDVRFHRDCGLPDPGFLIDFLDLDCTYAITRLKDRPRYNYSITLARRGASGAPACWHIEVDPKFDSRREYSYTPKRPNFSKKDQLEKDVDAVLQGMLFHPRNHAHVDLLGIISGLDGLSVHEVRLGGGIENVFVFLAHLRYQFCLCSEAARSEERRRLGRLFVESIRSNKDSLPPNDVLNPK